MSLTHYLSFGVCLALFISCGPEPPGKRFVVAQDIEVRLPEGFISLAPEEMQKRYSLYREQTTPEAEVRNQIWEVIQSYSGEVPIFQDTTAGLGFVLLIPGKHLPFIKQRYMRSEEVPFVANSVERGIRDSFGTSITRIERKEERTRRIGDYKYVKVHFQITPRNELGSYHYQWYVVSGMWDTFAVVHYSSTDVDLHEYIRYFEI